MKLSAVKVGFAVFVFAMTGCGGAKIKSQKKITALPEQRQSLVLANDENLSATLDWVLIRNSPESWAKNAAWDEYIFRLQALPSHQVQITNITVYDSLGTPLMHLNDRADLKKTSKQTIRRYKDEDLSVKPGAGAGVITAGATGAIFSAAYIAGTTASAGVTGLGGVAAFAGTAILLTPVFVIAGVVRGVHHHQVTKQIISIATVFPITVNATASKEVHVFYPFAPSPSYVEINYTDLQGAHKLNLDTKNVLAGLHMAKDKK